MKYENIEKFDDETLHDVTWTLLEYIIQHLDLFERDKMLELCKFLNEFINGENL